jgi:dihydrofolate reductase
MRNLNRFICLGLLLMGFITCILGCPGKNNPTTSSTSATNWVQATSGAAWSARNLSAAVSYNGNLWMIGGSYYNGVSYIYFSDVYSSANGSAWSAATTQAAFGQISGHTALVFNNKMWVIGGVNYLTNAMTLSSPLTPTPTVVISPSSLPTDNVYNSTDGISWSAASTLSALPPRYAHSAVVYGTDMWVMGGNSGGVSGVYFLKDCWYSPDGANWTQATASAAYGYRMLSMAVSFNGSMWLMGGVNSGSQVLPDVYNSTNGSTWNLVNGNAAFGPRAGAALFADGTNMWLVGGITSTTTVADDAWYSPDGNTWTQASTNVGFSQRAEMSCAFFNGKMWVLGGLGGSNLTSTSYNDVWHSP